MTEYDFFKKRILGSTWIDSDNISFAVLRDLMRLASFDYQNWLSAQQDEEAEIYETLNPNN